MTLPFDAYALRARLFPAIIATAPTLALAATLVSWQQFQPSQVVATLVMGVLLFVFADFARRQGRRIEPRLYERMGGKPSIGMLRHRDQTLHPDTKNRFLTFLAATLGERGPTKVDEETDPVKADAFYERCGGWLRENTRDDKKFRLLLEENITYGFRRNLLGMKGIGLLLSAATVALSGAIAFMRHRNDPQYDFTTFLLVLIVAAAHAVYFLLVVNERSVAEAARSYARQLLLSCELLMAPPTKTS